MTWESRTVNIYPARNKFKVKKKRKKKKKERLLRGVNFLLTFFGLSMAISRVGYYLQDKRLKGFGRRENIKIIGFFKTGVLCVIETATTFVA